MTSRDASGPGDPGESFSPEEDRRVLLRFVGWLVFCALLGAAFLVFSIWVDWV